MTKPQHRELAKIAKGEPALNMHDENARVRLANKGLAWRDEFHPWTWHLTDAGKAALKHQNANGREVFRVRPA